MSSRRCKILVKEDLEKLGLPHTILDYGVVEIMTDLQPEQLMHLKTNLIRSGWELLDDKRSLLYDGPTVKEISYRLQYSSVAHLSNQFKKITGLSPSFFKQLKQQRETPVQAPAQRKALPIRRSK